MRPYKMELEDLKRLKKLLVKSFKKKILRSVGLFG